MSHDVAVADRLELDPDTLPPAELLVTKLQIAELNEKDVHDALALFYDIQSRSATATRSTPLASRGCVAPTGGCAHP